MPACTPKQSQPTASEHRPAVGYVRVSTEEQAQGGVSVDAQTEKIRAYCNLHGLTLAEVLVDAGESGKSLDRPAMQELLARVGAGKVGAVVTCKMDRLTRSPRDLYMLVDDYLNARRVELVSIQEQVDTRSPAGRAMLGIMGVFAQMERELIAERTRTALAHKRERGDRLGATPLGFVTPEPGQDMQPVDAELEAVRVILRLRRAGGSFRAIAAELEAGGYATKRGGYWHPNTVRKVWQRRERYRAVLSPPTPRMKLID